ncbi:MAG: hypothetical protein DRO11_01095 [Methanobacteriota archaeon]|nr:MAG: hypothetical protein DRO11_01095 [Euryarchaeota archaeon]
MYLPPREAIELALNNYVHMLITVFRMIHTWGRRGRRHTPQGSINQFGWKRSGYPLGWFGSRPPRLSVTTPLGTTLTATHGNCDNFRNGFCTLYNIVVSPDGAACPSFTPKPPATAQPPPTQTPPTPGLNKIQVLQDLIEPLEQQLDRIKKEIEQLRKHV